MVWNKTPDDRANAILKTLLEMDKTPSQIAEEFEVSVWLVGEISRKHLTKEQRKDRHSILARKSKLGPQNPMFGKTGHNHHNSVLGPIIVSGYKAVFAPSWWKGSLVKGNRAYEHHIVWAEKTGNTSIPAGCVIHHIDEDKTNNDPNNLVCLSRSEHMKLHAEIRKEQRLSRKGVGNSVPEAQDTQLGDDIV